MHEVNVGKAVKAQKTTSKQTVAEIKCFENLKVKMLREFEVAIWLKNISKNVFHETKIFQFITRTQTNTPKVSQLKDGKYKKRSWSHFKWTHTHCFMRTNFIRTTRLFEARDFINKKGK